MNARKRKLKLILKDKSILFGNFTLASGKESSYYVDARLATLDPEGANLISGIFFEELAGWPDVTAVGGPSAGADPIVGALVSRSYEEGRPLRGFVVRKEEKKHGTGNLIEGNLAGGDKVAILEDVTTTGGSTLRAVDAVKAAGAEVSCVLSVVDRGEETEKIFSDRGCGFFSIFRISEFL